MDHVDDDHEVNWVEATAPKWRCDIFGAELHLGTVAFEQTARRLRNVDT